MHAIKMRVIQVVDWMTDTVVLKYPRHIPAFRFFCHPLILWRLGQAAKELATYTQLPPIAWKDVAKHGNNVVYGPEPKTAANIIFGLWVVDYTNKTRRVVFGLPNEMVKAGKTF